MTVETSQLDEIGDYTVDAVRNVFKTMVSIDLDSENPAPKPRDAEEEIAGSVGFIGKLSGAVFLYLDVSFAREVAQRMLGFSQADEVSNEMMHDVLGELANMIVGNIKSRLCDQGSRCTLTIPSIVRGMNLRIEKSSCSETRTLGFRFNDHSFLAEIILKKE